MNNPLTDFIRHPKIYIRLPSGGKFWPKGSIDIPETGEFPVYSMTVKDEITLKTPDALLNGQAVVDIIHSCIPNIKNAWHTPNIDLDTLLVAIRIASYGEMMEISHIVPGTQEEVNHSIDLRLILDQLSNADPWEDVIQLGENITCLVTPLTYKHVSQNSIKSFEAQRMITLLTDSEIPEDQKIDLLNQSVNTISDIAFNLILESIEKIVTPEAEVVEKEFIQEFLQNSDRIYYDQVKEHLEKMRDRTGIKPLEFSSSPEHIDLGAPETYKMPLNMDQSSFFVLKS
jgi:hypothetical protein